MKTDKELTKFKYLVLNHVAKCAGSSLRHSFYKSFKQNDYFSNNPVYISMLTHGNISLHRDKCCIKSIHKGTKAFIDHSYTNFIEEQFNLKEEETYRIFTIRNPISRFISHCLFFEKKHPKDLKTEELNSFILKFGHETISMLTQYSNLDKSLEERFEIARQEIKKYNFIFIQEKMEECICSFNKTNPFSLKLENVYDNVNSKKEDFVIDNNLRTYLEKELRLDTELVGDYYRI
jgi:hypothetical protein